MSPTGIEEGFEYKLRERAKKLFKEKIGLFELDMNRCLDKVVYDFPEFSNVQIRVRFDPFNINPLTMNYKLKYAYDNPYPLLIDCVISCNHLGLEALSNDERKEGALAHELGEAAHFLKKGKEGVYRIQRWNRDNKHRFGRRYRDMIEEYADLTAARRGYGYKIIEALMSFERLGFHVEDRVSNLTAYVNGCKKPEDM